MKVETATPLAKRTELVSPEKLVILVSSGVNIGKKIKDLLMGQPIKGPFRHDG